MQTELPASLENWISILHRCRQKKDLNEAKRLHSYLQEHELETHPILGNYLVPVLVECDSLQDARHVFDRLPCHNEYSWTSLISGYVSRGEPQRAFGLYHKMQDEACVPPNRCTYLALLNACTRLRDAEIGRRIHVELLLRGLECDISGGNAVALGNTLVDMYGKCGSHVEARQVFDKLPVQDSVSWNALIAGYAEHRLGEEADDCFHQMQLRGICPNTVTFVCLLKACGTRDTFGLRQDLHAELTKRGLERELHVGSTLVDMYTEFGLLREARQVFDGLSDRNVVAWNALITGYVELGLEEEVLVSFKQMQLDGLSPNAITFASSLKACGIMQSSEVGQGLHAETVKRGLGRDLYVGTTLVDMYGKCGLFAEAHQVFDRLPTRDIASWNALIAGYADYGLCEEVGNCFQKMQVEGVCPASVTFISSLKACGTKQASETVKIVHAEISKKGLESELYVGTTLVDTYTECGSLAEARHVLNQLPARGTISWNALIAGYAEYGFGEEALNCFHQMEKEGISPASVTFFSILKACGVIGALETGQEIHAEVIRKGVERDLYVGSTLVDMYGKCGLLEEARQVFDKLSARSAVSWNALISGYVEHGLGEDALESFYTMQLESISPASVTFICALKACGITRGLESGRLIHAHISKRGLEKELNLGNTLVDMYIKCRALVEARGVFDKLLDRGAVSWNALIGGYIENGCSEQVLNTFQQMQLEGICPDLVTLACCLKACSTIGSLESGQEIHTEVIKRGLENELHMGSTLLDLYIKCGFLEEAHHVFNWLPDKGVVPWNTLITGYAEHGFGEEVLRCLDRMQLGSFSPDSVTFFCGLRALGSERNLGTGQELHTEVVKRGSEGDVYVSSTLMTMYIKCGSFVEAQAIFDNLPFRNAVLWNALIVGYAELGLGEKTVNCFQQMCLEGLCPDSVTFVCSLKGCSIIQALETGQEIHADATKRGVERELNVGSTIVDMYGKCGLLAEAQHVFDGLQVRGAVSWNALIVGYTEHGRGREVLNCFQQMQLEGVSPSSVTFVCSLKACSTTGAVETGREIHDELIKRGEEAELHVGSTLLDMYGKCGSLAEAHQVFNGLPDRDAAPWAAMIRAFGENHAGHMALQCFNEMQKQGVKPDSITFTCLLTACSHASLIIKGQEYFKLMRAHEIEPSLEHYACMIDLFARSGHVYEAERLLAAMKCPPSSIILKVLLTACKVYGKVELGQKCFQQLVKLNQELSSAYLLMRDLYANVGQWDDANRLEEMRICAGAKKKPGSASVEVDKKLHEFVVGTDQSREIFETLEFLTSHLDEAGYVPNVDLVSKDEENELECFGFVNKYYLSLTSCKSNLCLTNCETAII